MAADGGAITRVRLSFAGGEAIARLRDHPTTRDFLSRLPIAMQARDYIGEEKIASFPDKLFSDGTSAADRGDFAYYAPWGNLALFYRGEGRAGGGLIVLGSFESGKQALAAMTDDFSLTIALID